MKKKSLKKNKKSSKKGSKIEKTVLKRYKDMLLEKRESLINEVQNRINDGKEYNKQEVKDTADQASASYENELFYGFSDTERKYLGEVENALERVDDGTYGKCDTCGKLISFERLKILPFVKFCIKCQQSSEKNISRR